MNQEQQTRQYQQQQAHNIINANDVVFNIDLNDDNNGNGSTCVEMEIERDYNAGSDEIVEFKSLKLQNFYNLQNDIGLMKFCTSALLNMPYTIKNNKIYPAIRALNELINQQKSSFVYNQYNYIERIPFMSNGSSSSVGIINEPYVSLSGIINEPVVRILKEIKKLERIKFCKALVTKNEIALKRNLSHIFKLKRKTLINKKDWDLKVANSIQKIYKIFKNNKPELFYTNKSVYLRNLNLQNGLHSDIFPFTG